MWSECVSMDNSNKKVNHAQSIVDLVGDDTLNHFYRGIYKSTYGPSIGFRIGGEWIYCSDLPQKTLDEIDQVVDAVSVSSIVEGSDVEIEGDALEGDFTTDEFWGLVKEVGEEVNFYWVRDNSAWMYVQDEKGDKVAWLRWEAFDDIVWEERGDLSKEICSVIESIIGEFYNQGSYPSPTYNNDIKIGIAIGKYEIFEYLNDSTYL
jgi:hypothetical protein